MYSNDIKKEVKRVYELLDNYEFLDIINATNNIGDDIEIYRINELDECCDKMENILSYITSTFNCATKNLIWLFIAYNSIKIFVETCPIKGQFIQRSLSIMDDVDYVYSISDNIKILS